MKRSRSSFCGVLSLAVSFGLLFASVPQVLPGEVMAGVLAPPVVVKKHRLHPHPWYRGKVVRVLPVGVATIHVGGIAFFYHLGVFYRHTNDGYVVVDAPVGARVTVLPDGCTTLHVEGKSFFVCGNVYYEPVGNEYAVLDRPPRGFKLPEAEVGQEVRITTNNLNVRSGPGRNHRVITQLQDGDIVKVADMNQEWYFTRLPGGATGWIMKKFTRPYEDLNRKGNG